MFNDYENSPNVISNGSDKKRMISWKNFLKKVIDDFKHTEFVFSHIAEMHIITIANNMDITYDFYLKHSKFAIEWKLNATVNKNKSLITKFPCNWRHSLYKKI